MESIGAWGMIIGVIVLLIIILYFIPIGLWFSALVSGVRISLLQLFLMRFRKVPPGVIVRALIEGTKAGVELNRDDLEAHYLAGGHVNSVVHALVSASKANINLPFKMATAIDLAGRDVFEAVRMSVNPKVINTPPVTAVAKDGIQLIAKARVTVRANIRQLVGGAGEETVLARVGEGIVSSIGSSHSHKTVLENPDSISRVVLEKGLDAGTAFEILSIDIADMDIGKNIGAVLQMDQAEADKNIAQAKAEERRAMAVALEQEMKAKAQEARVKVIEAEVQVPLAISEAFKAGNIGVMDYMRYKNIMADTSMRDSISDEEEKGETTDFHVKKVLKNYLPGDTESKDYAVLLEWDNIYYTRPRPVVKQIKSEVRMGLVQWQMRPYKTIEDVVEQIEFFVDAVSGYRSDFVFFPEFFNAPLMAHYNHLSEAEAIRELAQTTLPLRDRFEELAISYNINIITGSMPLVEDDKLYNVGFLCKRNGEYNHTSSFI